MIPRSRLQEQLLYRVTVEHTLEEALEHLAAEGVMGAPIKGAYFFALWPEFFRPVQDVDLLVDPGAFERAVGVLERLGYEPRSVQSFATMMVDPCRALPVDLHRDCFPEGMFGLSARGVLARARRSDVVFGAPGLVIDPLDAYALAVGHLVKDRAFRDSAERLADLKALGDHFTLEPTRVASHLHLHGLGRAAGHALGLAAEAGDPLARAVLDALPPDPLGDLAVAAARRWMSRWPSEVWQAAPAAHLLNADLPHACASAWAHLKSAVPRRTVRAIRRWRASRG